MAWFNKQKGDEVAVADAIVGSISPEEASDKIGQFVSESPLAVYMIDGKKNTETSIICRATENGGQTCLNLSISGVSLFKTMQGKSYFCSLPPDVDDTHFECRKIT